MKFAISLILKAILIFVSLSLGHMSSNRDTNSQYIYWTPTTANIIEGRDNSGSPFITPYVSNTISPIAYPQTFTSYNYPQSTVTATGTIYPSNPVPYGTGYYYSSNNPGWMKIQRKEGLSAAPSKPEQKFDGLREEVKSLKAELFGNTDANMDFYKQNKNAYYDSKWLQRAQKIARILDLEELLHFYDKNQEKQKTAPEKVEKQKTVPEKVEKTEVKKTNLKQVVKPEHKPSS